MWLLYKLARPILPISAGLAAWIISRFCGATVDTSIAAAFSIALSTIGASIYHYGGANWMYTRKSERLKFRDPQLLMLGGLCIFSLSIGIAVEWLPKPCVYICLFNTLAVAAYSAKLSAHWLTKNITMGFVCATPIVLGWKAGTITHPIVTWAIAVAFIAHIAREMIKDVKDILANHGRRVTLPMVLGTQRVLQIAGILLLASSVMTIFMLKFTTHPLQEAFVVTSVVVLIGTSCQLILHQTAKKSETMITAALMCAMLALL